MTEGNDERKFLALLREYGYNKILFWMEEDAESTEKAALQRKDPDDVKKWHLIAAMLASWRQSLTTDV